MKSWTSQEDKLLLQTYEITPRFRRWKVISAALNKKGVSKSQYECRERYINKLDPQISGVEWKSEEIQQVFDNFQTLGSHWSSVQKFLPGRTQSSIKNKFYGILRNFVRAILKINGFKVRKLPQDISTNRLISLYKGEKEFQGFKDFIKNSLKILNYKVTSRDIKQKLDQKLQKIKELCQVLSQPKQENQQTFNKQDQIKYHQNLNKHIQIVVKEEFVQEKQKPETPNSLQEKKQLNLKLALFKKKSNTQLQDLNKIKIQDLNSNFNLQGTNNNQNMLCFQDQISYQNFYLNRIQQSPYHLFLKNMNDNAWQVNIHLSPLYNSLRGSFYGNPNEGYCYRPYSFQEIWYQNFGYFQNQNQNQQ